MTTKLSMLNPDVRKVWIPPFRGFALPKPHPWFVAKEQLGEISGIPTIAGKVLATNGPLVVVQREDGKLFFAHSDWFVKEKQIRATKAEKRSEFIEALLRDFENTL